MYIYIIFWFLVDVTYFVTVECILLRHEIESRHITIILILIVLSDAITHFLCLLLSMEFCIVMSSTYLTHNRSFMVMSSP